MAIPHRQDFMLPILKIASDGKQHSNHEVYEMLTQEFGLSETDRMEMIDSNRDRKFDNRVRWAINDLRHAFLLSGTEKSKFRITERGMNVLKNNPSHIDHEFLKQFPEYLAYLRRAKTEGKDIK